MWFKGFLLALLCASLASEALAESRCRPRRGVSIQLTLPGIEAVSGKISLTQKISKQCTLKKVIRTKKRQVVTGLLAGKGTLKISTSDTMCTSKTITPLIGTMRKVIRLNIQCKSTQSISRADSSTPTATPHSTETGSPTPTLTGSPTNEPTPTQTPTVTQTMTATPVKSGTATATKTPTSTPTPTRTGTATFTRTSTPTTAPTISATPTPSRTPTTAGTPTITPTPTNTPNFPGVSVDKVLNSCQFVSPNFALPGSSGFAEYYLDFTEHASGANRFGTSRIAEALARRAGERLSIEAGTYSLLNKGSDNRVNGYINLATLRSIDPEAWNATNPTARPVVIRGSEGVSFNTYIPQLQWQPTSEVDGEAVSSGQLVYRANLASVVNIAAFEAQAVSDIRSLTSSTATTLRNWHGTIETLAGKRIRLLVYRNPKDLVSTLSEKQHGRIGLSSKFINTATGVVGSIDSSNPLIYGNSYVGPGLFFDRTDCTNSDCPIFLRVDIASDSLMKLRGQEVKQTPSAVRLFPELLIPFSGSNSMVSDGVLFDSIQWEGINRIALGGARRFTFHKNNIDLGIGILAKSAASRTPENISMMSNNVTQSLPLHLTFGDFKIPRATSLTYDSANARYVYTPEVVDGQPGLISRTSNNGAAIAFAESRCTRVRNNTIHASYNGILLDASTQSHIEYNNFQNVLNDSMRVTPTVDILRVANNWFRDGTISFVFLPGNVPPTHTGSIFLDHNIFDATGSLPYRSLHRRPIILHPDDFLPPSIPPAVLDYFISEGTPVQCTHGSGVRCAPFFFFNNTVVTRPNKLNQSGPANPGIGSESILGGDKGSSPWKSFFDERIVTNQGELPASRPWNSLIRTTVFNNIFINLNPEANVVSLGQMGEDKGQITFDGNLMLRKQSTLPEGERRNPISVVVVEPSKAFWRGPTKDYPEGYHEYFYKNVANLKRSFGAYQDGNGYYQSNNQGEIQRLTPHSSWELAIPTLAMNSFLWCLDSNSCEESYFMNNSEFFEVEDLSLTPGDMKGYQQSFPQGNLNLVAHDLTASGQSLYPGACPPASETCRVGVN